MAAKLVKLDARHKGHGVWGWFVDSPPFYPLNSSRRKFFEWREWCWSEWGPSKEIDEFNSDDFFDEHLSNNDKWCWLNDGKGRRRIYLRGDPEASAFALRWL